MSTELAEVHILDEYGELTLVQLADLSGLSQDELRELVDLGAIAPTHPGEATITFTARCVVTARTACRLRQDFELNVEGVALALSLISRISDLEAQLSGLRAQLPRRIR